MDDFFEEKLKNKVLKILENGRPGWDAPHTLAVAHYIKELVKSEGGNGLVLVCAAYLHDIGWAGADFENNYQSIKNAKDSHMEKGVLIAGPILDDFKGLLPNRTLAAILIFLLRICKNYSAYKFICLLIFANSHNEILKFRYKPYLTTDP